MTSFSALLGAIGAASSTYHVDISEDWQQGRTTFGGLTAALWAQDGALILLARQTVAIFG